MTAAWLIRGDARRLPLKDGSVQVCVTSPPFFGLRAYKTTPVEWGDGWTGELGSEPTPAAFVAHLVEVFAEVWRVLRPDGVAFLNMGSSMAGSGKGPTGHNGVGDQSTRQGFVNQRSTGSRPKSDLLIPFRLAIALDEAGWIVRQVLIWAKPNPMPESVRDRWTSSHEYILMLTKQGRYYFNQEAIREPHADDWHARASTWRNGDAKQQQRGETYHDYKGAKPFDNPPNPAGRNGRSVWTIPTAQYPGAHYAVFNEEIPRRCIAAATSEYGACAACGAAYKRSTTRVEAPKDRATGRGWQSGIAEQDNWPSGTPTHSGLANGTYQRSETTGWQPTCRCGPDAGIRPCVVLDPFSGSGTSAYVAASMGRIGIGVELSAEYIEQARYGRLRQDFLPLQAARPAAGRGAGEGT